MAICGGLAGRQEQLQQTRQKGGRPESAAAATARRWRLHLVQQWQAGYGMAWEQAQGWQCKHGAGYLWSDCSSCRSCGDAYHISIWKTAAAVIQRIACRGTQIMQLMQLMQIMQVIALG